MILIFSLLTNNYLSVLLSAIILGYNIYSRIKNLHNFNIIIGDRKNNVGASNNISLIYKIKFVLYTIVAIYAMFICVLSFFKINILPDKLQIIKY